MQPTEVLDLLHKKAHYPEMDRKLLQWRNVYYDISLHTLGICPWFDIGPRRINPAGYYDSRYHFEYQNRFIYHLLNRHPRESNETLNWRLSRYKPLTKAPFQTVTELVTGAIFQDGNYSIEIPDQSDADYIWGNNFYGKNLVGYFAEIGYKNMVEDPNGFFIRLPKKPYYEYAQGEDVEIEILFINSTHIKYITHDEVIFCYEGYAWHVDRMAIWRYKETKEGQYELLPEDAEGYYAHMFGKLPISIAGGEWNSKKYYDSYYDKAKAAADVFIDTFSSQQLVDKNASHPFIIESSENCPTCHGNRQFQNCNNCQCDTKFCKCGNQENWSLIDCHSCGGEGVIASDPSRRKIVPADQLKDGQHVQIVSPDVAVNKHHIELCEIIMKMIKEALHLNLIDEAQSGTAKGIDQDRQYKFISKISNHIFDDLIRESISDIIAYRNVVASVNGVQPSVYQFKIVKPQQFDIKTAQMLLDEYKTVSESGMPNYMKTAHLLKYADKQFSGDDSVLKMTQVISQLDPYSLDNTDEKLSKKVAGVLTTEQWILSDTYPLILQDIVRDLGEEWFIDADFEKIKQEIDRRKIDYMPAINPMQQQALQNMQEESVRIDA